MGKSVAGAGKFVRWDTATLIEQVESVCEIVEDGCWIWRYRGFSDYRYAEIMIKGRRASVPRWVLWADTGSWGPVARHTCDVLPCCNPDHLLWGTPAENMADRFERGNSYHPTRRPRSDLKGLAVGERHGLARLTEKQVLEMREQHRRGVSNYRIAKNFGVAKRTASMITGRITWKHLP